MSSDIFGSPHVEMVSGEKVEFPRLDMEDLEAWGNEIQATRKAKERERVDKMIYPNPKMKRDALDALEDQFGELNFRYVLGQVLTPSGVRKTLDKSLDRAGKSPDERKAIVKNIPLLRREEIAREIAGIPAVGEAKPVGDDQGNDQSAA